MTPADLHGGLSSAKIEANGQYCEHEQQKEEAPWKRSCRDVLKGAMDLENMTGPEVVTTFCFFCPRLYEKPLTLDLRGL
jgi:hypothetical protein